MNIVELKKIICDFGSDNVKVFNSKFEGGIHLQQVIEEITPCIHDLLNTGQKFENFLEIGAAAGGNSFLFNYFFKFNSTVIIDDNKHKKYNLRKQILKNINYKEFIGDSHSVESLNFINNLDIKFDMMFIDGDHSYMGVKLDTEMYINFLNSGGFVIYHDTVACTGVKQIFNEMKNNICFKFVNEYVSQVHYRPCGIGIFQKIS